MGKIVKFWALLLVVTVAVQHIQIERVKDQGRENWKQFRIEMDAMYAEAGAAQIIQFPLRALPVFATVGGLGAAMAFAPAIVPYILAGIVIGGAIYAGYWVWKHWDKEAFIVGTQAFKNGQPVTKDWLQREIARLKGIDIDGGAIIEESGFVHIGEKKYQISAVLNYSIANAPVSLGSPPYCFGNVNTASGFVYEPNSGNNILYIRKARVPNSDRYYYQAYELVPNSESASEYGTFNPSDYPELYEGKELIKNCRAVMEANPDIDYHLGVPQDNSWKAGFPFDKQPHPAPVQLAGKRSDGALVDKNGRVWPPVPTIADQLDLPILDPERTDEIQIVPNLEPSKTLKETLEGAGVRGKILEVGPDYIKWQGTYGDAVTTTVPEELAGRAAQFAPRAETVVVPKALKEALAEAGVQGKILEVGPDYIKWQGEYGPATVTPVPEALAARAASFIPAESGVTSIRQIDPSKPEIDPGNPADPALPDVPIFDPEMDWGEEQEWPWESWATSLPFIDVLKSSSVGLSGSTSSISCNITLLGQSKTISYDFSEWNWLLNSMGILIYACACWYALQLALLKRD